MIYHVGEEFLVNSSELGEGETPNKIFVGAVSIKEGVVTHLWLRGIGDICDVGYEVTMIKPVR